MKLYHVLLPLLLSLTPLLALLLLAGCGSAEPEEESLGPPTAPHSLPLAELADAPEWAFPQRRRVNGGTLILHAPQVREWHEFHRAVAQIAFEYLPDGARDRAFGNLTLAADTVVDLPGRIVTLSSIDITDVRFSAAVPERYQTSVSNAATRDTLATPLDLFLGYLAADVLDFPAPDGFNREPPAIHVAYRPTIVLFVNGEPVREALGDTGASIIVNANWPLIDSTTAVYLRHRDRWLTAERLDGDWSAAQGLPEPLAVAVQERPGMVPPKGAEVALEAPAPVPVVLPVKTPTELIRLTGEPRLEAIAGAEGLADVSNSEQPLLHYDDRWYFLVSGRWFTTAELDSGPWTYVDTLPNAFQLIPTDHRRADVLASVPGTFASKLAALEALIPVTHAVEAGSAGPAVTFADAPHFEAIADTGVARAVNSSYDVLEYAGGYYLCHGGAWYHALSPHGPWVVTADVPASFYDIPPSSPSYPVTQVSVQQQSTTSIVFTYPSSYTTHVYVVSGVPVYGTGWYYPPCIYGPAYYPYPVAYGHGTWYNPNRGGYGSRSVAYGPYGGYSYTSGYNPGTGRYGYVETAWDSDEWASYGETFNPRSGVYSETSRYFDEDDQRSEMNREVSRGERSVETDRVVDFDDGGMRTTRQGSGGAVSESRRDFDDGRMTSQGTMTGADGRSATFSGEHTRDGGQTTISGSQGGDGTITRDATDVGATREGEFTRGDDTIDTETRRNGSNRITTAESSDGGQLASASGGLGDRTTLAQSASGDLYAGHEGNVYKKTDSGWQYHDGDGWQSIDTPARPTPTEGATASRDAFTFRRESDGGFSQSFQSVRASPDRSSSRYGSYGNRSWPSTTPSRSSLGRDYEARQHGFSRAGQLRGGRGLSGSGRRR